MGCHPLVAGIIVAALFRICVVNADARILQGGSSACTSTNSTCALGLVATNATGALYARGTCCECPDGTTTAYADQSLLWRFSQSGISMTNTMPVWAADGGQFAFTTYRPDDPGADTLVYQEPHKPPDVTVPPGHPPGIHFDESPAAAVADNTKGYNEALYGNRSMIIGAENTFFAVVTADASTMPFSTILSFRPGVLVGQAQMSWMTTSSGGPAGTRLGELWPTIMRPGQAGHSGPRMLANKTQLLVFRSSKRRNSIGQLAPWIEIAVLDNLSHPVSLNWADDAFGDPAYWADTYASSVEPITNFSYDMDFRNQAVDGRHAFAAGVPILGNWYVACPPCSFTQFRGTIHHLELHGATLSDAEVLDVVNGVRHLLDPIAAQRLKCIQCPPGQRDEDNNPDTLCTLCGPGTFASNSGSIGTCQGTCALGRTITDSGSASTSDCSLCTPGRYGLLLFNNVSMCEPCPLGRFSAATGVVGNSTCLSCPTGQFSSLGWTKCAPSGCTDEWATNFDPAAVIDMGLCEYKCSQLWTRAGSGFDASCNDTVGCKVDCNSRRNHTRSRCLMNGGCLLWEPQANRTWFQGAFRSVATPGGWLPRLSDDSVAMIGPYSTADTVVYTDWVLTGERWLMQGRPLAGHTSELPMYPMHQSRYSMMNAAFNGPLQPASAGELIVRSCNFSSHDLSGGQGGALWGIGGTFSIMHTVFDQNGGDMNTGSGIAMGGAFECYSGCVASFDWALFKENSAVTQGGAMDFKGGVVNVTHSQYIQNVAKNIGGAIAVGVQGVVNLAWVAFSGNKATKGGAIFLGDDSSAFINTCTFSANRAEDKGGAISSIKGGLKVATSHFIDNVATTAGSALHVIYPPVIRVSDTSFLPFYTGFATIFLGGRLGGCDAHPCPPGFSCAYVNYSLWCTPCPVPWTSTNGLQCNPCTAGHGPLSDATGCKPCIGNNFSAFGVCHPCSGTASHDRTGCEPCPHGQVPAPDLSGCQCEWGRYNASQLGIITCEDQDFQSDLFDRDVQYSVARDQVSHMRLQCIECPMCLNCLVSPVTVQPGFMLAPGVNTSSSANKTFMRCRPETAHTDGLGSDGTGFDAFEGQCLGGNLGHAACRIGYTGILCAECAEDYGRKNVNECHHCDDSLDPLEILKFVCILFVAAFVMGLILIALSFRIGDVYHDVSAETSNVVVKRMRSWDNPLVSEEESPHTVPGTEESAEPKSARAISHAKILRTSKRVLSSGMSMTVQPAKIFLGYWQITAHLGAVLHFQFPRMLSGLFAWFKPLVVNINGVVAMECAGLKHFYSTWVFEVFIVPAVLWIPVACYWVYRLSKQGRVIANAKASDEAFLILFICYPFVTNKLFGILNCRQLDRTLRVLVVDYSINCDTDTHAIFYALSLVLIVLFSIGVPVTMIVLMAANKRAKERQFDTPQWKYIARRSMAELAHDNLREVKYVIVDITLGSRYGTLVNAYKPGFFCKYFDLCYLFNRIPALKVVRCVV